MGKVSFRWATTAGLDKDNFIDHDSGYAELKDAVEDCRRSMVDNQNAGYGYVEECENGDSEVVATMVRGDGGLVVINGRG